MGLKAFPESGFQGPPAVLADIINAVAYQNVRGQDNSSYTRVTGEVVQPQCSGGSEVGYETGEESQAGARDGVEVVCEGNECDALHKRQRRE
jgi:hypothetical protein